MDRSNIHATALVLDGRGVLIVGASGAGKTALALVLIGLFRAAGRFAVLVADDRVDMRVLDGRIVARVPRAIAGLAEIRGFGVAPVPHEQGAVVDLVVRLCEPSRAPRHRQDAVETLLAVGVPALDLPAGDPHGCARAVAACLGLA